MDEGGDGESCEERGRVSDVFDFPLERPLLTCQMPWKPFEAPGKKQKREKKGHETYDARQIDEKIRERRRPSEIDRLGQKNEPSHDRRENSAPEDPMEDGRGRPVQEPGVPEPPKVVDGSRNQGGVPGRKPQGFGRGDPEGPNDPPHTVQNVPGGQGPVPPGSQKALPASPGDPHPEGVPSPVAGFFESLFRPGEDRSPGFGRSLGRPSLVRTGRRQGRTVLLRPWRESRKRGLPEVERPSSGSYKRLSGGFHNHKGKGSQGFGGTIRLPFSPEENLEMRHSRFVLGHR